MKRVILVWFLWTTLPSFSQSNWITKEIGSKISAKFPSSPTYRLVNKAGTYTCKTENNLLAVIVQYDALPNYSDFVKLSAEEQDKLVEVFLDNTIKGLLKASGSDDTSFTNIQVGEYKGREVSYKSINPVTGDRTMKFCKLLYAFNRVYMFQCMYLNDQGKGKKEKDSFLNSITIN